MLMQVFWLSALQANKTLSGRLAEAYFCNREK